MITYVALLRGINVGGKCLISMADLPPLVEALQFTAPRTLLQSGNLIFQGREMPREALEKRLEAETTRRLGLSVDFLVRTGTEWKSIVAASPFHLEAVRDPSHLLVMCLKDTPTAEAVASLKENITGREYFHATGRELYLVYPDGIGRSKLTNAVIERKLATRGTSRNWNTVQKIAALL